MACVGVTLANRAAAPKWKNLRRLWSETSSVMTHLQILSSARGIDADHSRHRRRPQGIYGHQFGVSVPAQRLRAWVSAARPRRRGDRVQGLRMDLALRDVCLTLERPREIRVSPPALRQSN